MSAHTPGPWSAEQARAGDMARTVIRGPDNELVAVIESGSTPANRAMLTAAPRLADALWGLMVALGLHTANMTPEMLADICPACDAATAALIASGKVLG